MNNITHNKNNNQINNQRKDREDETLRRRRYNHKSDSFEYEDKEIFDKSNAANQCNNNNYRVKADISLFYGITRVDDFLDWQIEVDRFFEVMEISEHKYVNMIAKRLKTMIVEWWNKLVNQNKRQEKRILRPAGRMKQLMMDEFFSINYKKRVDQRYKPSLKCFRISFEKKY